MSLCIILFFRMVICISPQVIFSYGLTFSFHPVSLQENGQFISIFNPDWSIYTVILSQKAADVSWKTQVTLKNIIIICLKCFFCFSRVEYLSGWTHRQRPSWLEHDRGFVTSLQNVDLGATRVIMAFFWWQHMKTPWSILVIGLHSSAFNAE